MASPALARWLWLAWPLGLAPLGWSVWAGLTGASGPDPAKALVSDLGWWGLFWLLACLSVRPSVQIFGLPWLFPLRRHFGLLAFTWLSLHLIAWAWLLLGLDLSGIAGELVKRPYILVGFTAWCLLVPLALTSSRVSRRRLGRRWVRLHKLVYPAALLGVLHDFWLQKAGYLEPAVFAMVLVGLLLWRWQQRRKRPGLVAS